ncbi:MAG: pyridoxal 5'-phosphate synthase glutaminase subunit PdxT [Pseudobutyrivibrio sp.]|nr:pyridoxal 5'-phosphate synthase glutaminase subunit PdxT [Pseudobutyrivibrio sp.]
MSARPLTVGVLALQGAFIEHINVLKNLGVDVYEIRQKSDLETRKYDGLVLPGGESTTQSNLLKKVGLFNDIKKLIEDGMPVLATCAGAILLSEKVTDGEKHFGTLPVSIKRNAYGRQLGSFITKGRFGDYTDIPMNFIRAPYFEKVNNPDVKVLSIVQDKTVAVQYKNQIAMSFHPEVTGDDRVHKYFISEINK